MSKEEFAKLVCLVPPEAIKHLKDIANAETLLEAACGEGIDLHCTNHRQVYSETFQYTCLSGAHFHILLLRTVTLVFVGRVAPSAWTRVECGSIYKQF